MTRWFELPCDFPAVSEHQPGDRHWQIGERDTEWTGRAWTLVCPSCDVPMVGRTGAGWLCCDRCGLMHDQVPERTVQPSGVLL
jgi:hypothetical protein